MRPSFTHIRLLNCLILKEVEWGDPGTFRFDWAVPVVGRKRAPKIATETRTDPGRNINIGKPSGKEMDISDGIEVPRRMSVRDGRKATTGGGK